MKSLHYDQCFHVYVHTYVYTHVCVCVRTYIFVVSSRRNKTNPYHRNKFIPVLIATPLQAFKPKLSTYDQLLTTNQQAVSFYRCVCVSWNIFNRIHFFASCDVKVFMQFVRLKCDFIYDEMSSWRSSFDKLFFSSYTIFFTLLNNCITHSHTSRTIASSQYHPRETRSLLGWPNLYRNSVIGFAYDEFISYNDEK